MSSADLRESLQLHYSSNLGNLLSSPLLCFPSAAAAAAALQHWPHLSATKYIMGTAFCRAQSFSLSKLSTCSVRVTMMMTGATGSPAAPASCCNLWRTTPGERLTPGERHQENEPEGASPRERHLVVTPGELTASLLNSCHHTLLPVKARIPRSPTQPV